MYGPIISWLLSVDRVLNGGPAKRTAPTTIHIDARSGLQLVAEIGALKGSHPDIELAARDTPRAVVGGLTVEWPPPRTRIALVPEVEFTEKKTWPELFSR